MARELGDGEALRCGPQGCVALLPSAGQTAQGFCPRGPGLSSCRSGMGLRVAVQGVHLPVSPAAFLRCSQASRVPPRGKLPAPATDPQPAQQGSHAPWPAGPLTLPRPQQACWASRTMGTSSLWNLMTETQGESPSPTSASCLPTTRSSVSVRPAPASPPPGPRLLPPSLAWGLPFGPFTITGDGSGRNHG